MEKHFVIPEKIREACEAVLKCKSKKSRVVGPREFWSDHYPKGAIEEFLSAISSVKGECNKEAQEIMTEILHRKHLWLDRESTPTRWHEFESLVNRLRFLTSYL